MILQNDSVKTVTLIHLGCDIYVFLNKICQKSTYCYLKVHDSFLLFKILEQLFKERNNYDLLKIYV